MTKREETKATIVTALNIYSTTAAKLVESCHYSKSTVARSLKDLVNDGQIVKNGKFYSLVIVEEEKDTVKVGGSVVFDDKAMTVDTTQFEDHIKALSEMTEDSFVASKNYDGRKGLWLTSQNYKYRVLLAKSGSCRIFMERLSDAQIHRFNVSDDIDINIITRRVLAPAKPAKLNADELVNLVRTNIEKSSGKYSRK